MTDVTENFRHFSTALRVLVPIFEQARIIWSDEGQYDEFYNVADSLFHSLVISIFTDDPQFASKYQTYCYGMSGNRFQFSVFDSKSNLRVGEFIRLVTRNSPFDTLELRGDENEEPIELPFLGARIMAPESLCN